MRILSYILSLYMLVLLAIPCIDAPLDTTVVQTEYSQSIPTNHQHHTDHCSPLCTCQCCASPLVFTQNSIQFTAYFYLQKLISAYTSIAPFSCISPIWQPPKLS